MRRPEDYSPEQGARFEVHFEKLRNRVDSVGAISLEARLEAVMTDAGEGIGWSSRDRQPSILKQATQLYGQGLSVRQVAGTLHISKTEAGRIRLRATDQGLIARTAPEKAAVNGHSSTPMETRGLE